MPATPIATVNRYWPTGTSKWLFCPSVANIQAITRAEINAGTDLTREVAATEGWSTTGELIETPDGDSRFVARIPGKITADDSSITFYLDPSGVDARALFPRDTSGFIIRMPGGDIAGRLCDVFPARVTTATKLVNVGEEEAGRLQVAFAIVREPAEDIVIPA
ncbi:hypothetical protein DP939_02615 [Spongiactinospora rosea]|uniref:Uncharacterized protein n=1 Tax=Spongiactinospora rosea TaxID=2248750 RepID=A0A366M834_9ACTN|nr:hypothetical protein [Spongiactinospora rosea]RBQ21622.1 hypothetical protein DP939_02615 [Spongiactinospora rosea]